MAAPIGSRKPKDTMPHDPKDNQTPEMIKAAKEAAEAVQLLSIMSQLRAQKNKTALKKKEYDIEKEAENVIYRLAKAANFLRKDLDEYLDKQNSSVRDLVEEEETRTRRFLALGLPIYKQDDMIGDEVKDAKMWRAEGYLAAMRGEPAKLPVGMSGEFTNDFLGGHADGVAATNKASAPEVAAPDPVIPVSEPEKPVTRNQEQEAL